MVETDRQYYINLPSLAYVIIFFTYTSINFKLCLAIDTMMKPALSKKDSTRRIRGKEKKKILKKTLRSRFEDRKKLVLRGQW